jgi:hypothetical protein
MALAVEKRCSTCGLFKTLDQFRKYNSSKDGLKGICKLCQSKSEARHAQSNPIGVKTNKMICGARKRAKEKQVAFDIDHAYIRSIVPSHCPVLGVELDWSVMRGPNIGPLPNSPSLDRIDPSKGYIKGNVWIISHRANSIKNDASHEELKLVTEAVGRAIVNSLDW